MPEDKIILREEPERGESERLKIERKLREELAGWQAMRKKNYEMGGAASQNGNNGLKNKRERREPIVIIKPRKNLEDK